MASLVRIESGEVEATTPLSIVPRDKWGDLVELRKQYVKSRFGYDCRNIAKWYNDAGQMWEEMGYDSIDDMMRRAYGIEEVDYVFAIKYIERTSGGKTIGLSAAISEQKAIEAIDVTMHNATVNQSKPSRQNGEHGKGVMHITPFDDRGTNSTYLQRRMARDAPEVLQDLAAGRYKSTIEAARAAGIAPPKRQRLSMYADDPKAAAAYLAERVDPDWMRALLMAYHAAISKPT